MRKINVLIVGVVMMLVCPLAAWPGEMTANQFLYKPAEGARGTLEKQAFDQGLDRVDARLGKEVWIGDPQYGDTLQSVLATLGAAPAVVRVSAGSYNITSNLTVPNTITLKLEQGAMLAIDSGKTLTINGGIEAGPYRVFSGAGNVSLGANISTASAWWWYDGGGDWQPAIQAAINALTSGVVTVPEGNLTVGNTIQEKTNVELRLSAGTVIKPSGDFDVILLVMGSKLSGGRIDVSGVTGYSHGAVHAYSSTFNGARKTYVHDLELIGNPNTFSGVGMDLDGSSGYRVTAFFADNVLINNFNIGINLHASSGGYVNGNVFANIKLSSPTYGIQCLGGGNHFTNIDFQAGTNTQRAFYLGGSNNRLMGMVWDYGTAASSYALEFAVSSNNNTVLCSLDSQYVLDRGQTNRVIGAYDQLSNVPTPATIIPPASYANPSFLGAQDDVLAFCYKNGATITTSPAPTGGAINNVFQLNPLYEADWTAASLPATITIALPQAITPSFMGIKFKIPGRAPHNVTWEVYCPDTSTWYTVKTFINNTSDFLWVQAMDIADTNPRGAISKIRLTLDGTSADYIGVSRIFAYSTINAGTAFVQKGGDTAFDQLGAYNGFLAYGPVKFSHVNAPGACTPTLVNSDGNLGIGNYSYKITLVTANGETEAGTVSNVVTTDATHKQVQLSAIPTGSFTVTSRKIYRTAAGGSSYNLVATINDNTTTTYTDNIADGSLGAAAPTYNTTAGLFYNNGANPVFQITNKAPNSGAALVRFLGGVAPDYLGFFSGTTQQGQIGLGGGGLGLLLRCAALQTLRLDNNNAYALELQQTAIRLTMATSGDSPYEDTKFYRVTTTDATPTALATVGLADGHVYTVQATVTTRCTGGTGANAGKGATYKFIGTFKRDASPVTQIGATTVIHAAEEVSGWDAAFTVSGNNVLVNVTGGAADNMTWHAMVKISGLGS
jgi:hypothetical protein